MTKLLTLEEGIKAVKLARNAIEVYLKEKKVIDTRYDGVFAEKRGVFVTLRKNKELRGCIGFPYPYKRLDEAIIESAISAATQDPRFRPLSTKELDVVTVEVTILTPPEKIEVDVRKISEQVEIGRHGLLIKRGIFSGLLLPQVAIEFNFDSEEFLSQTCMKAGLPPDCWLMDGTEIYRFEGQIFEEVEPGGEVVEVDMRSCKV
ncbi:uncharacterized protein, PH0010 family [Archaeoglobus sulfaticallidus PM70-1]|uniref:Protein Asulf_00238 n=1 Tax=Archaeoglobus sulfaticallidus PM70-1 TaxID=387631 RepID=N0BDD9_9EURY|nr:TIGR00296 family protein [Archaeoglobus sulfaticallidus]AGK60272.1 uncharacterized protein, PH0010 family [Archaeoglobus sulfaticallidus PM70-1]